MKLTKRKALEECEKLWRWLEENPRRGKVGWEGWGEYIKLYENNDACPCCDYVIQYSPSTKAIVRRCDLCPLTSLWPSHIGCMWNKCSPYQKWIDAQTSKAKKRYAKIIADECNRLLAKKRV